MMSDAERITELERLADNLVELVGLQVKRLDRIEVAVRLADSPADVAMAKLTADEAKAIARGAAMLAAAGLS